MTKKGAFLLIMCFALEVALSDERMITFFPILPSSIPAKSGLLLAFKTAGLTY